MGSAGNDSDFGHARLRHGGPTSLSRSGTAAAGCWSASSCSSCSSPAVPSAPTPTTTPSEDKIADGDHGRRRRRRRPRGRRRPSALVRRQLLRPLRKRRRSATPATAWTLPAKKLKVRADVDGMVDEALDASREGGPAEPPGPLRQRRRRRRARSAPRSPTPSRRSTASCASVAERASTASPATPRSKPSGTELNVVAGENGSELRDNLLERAAAGRGHSTRAATAHDRGPRPARRSPRSPPRSSPPSTRPTSRSTAPTLHAAALQEPEAGQDLHRRRRPGRPRHPRRASTDLQNKQVEPDLERARIATGPATSPAVDLAAAPRTR